MSYVNVFIVIALSVCLCPACSFVRHVAKKKLFKSDFFDSYQIYLIFLEVFNVKYPVFTKETKSSD